MSRRKSSLSRPSAIALAAALAALPLSAVRAQPAPTPAAAPPAGPSRELGVAVGKSQVLELSQPYRDLMIADPKIADVLPLNRHSVYVVGKAPGATALTVYGPGKQLIASTNVVVSSDIDGLKSRLAELLPEEHGVTVRAANQSLIVSGTVTSPAALQQVLALAESYAPTKVVNMLSVQGTQQIMLSVRFVEMDRTIAKDLRVNIDALSKGNPAVRIFTGDTLVKNAGNLVDSFGAISLLYNNNLEALVDALEQKGLIRTLAEPTLVAMSGDTANFLAGGEFPIPVAQTNGGLLTAPTITVEFKQFGIGLAFTPTLLGDGLINIVVNPEVSAIDPTISVDLGQIKVPGIRVRRAHTTVELHDGESFTIAGLLRDDYISQIRQYPFLGDLPIIGSLMRSNGFQRDQSELVIIVTPHLATPRRGLIATPTDRFTPPSDLERFLLGYQQGVGRKLSPEDRALLSADPNKGGIDGPHGHVLY